VRGASDARGAVGGVLTGLTSGGAGFGPAVVTGRTGGVATFVTVVMPPGITVRGDDVVGAVVALSAGSSCAINATWRPRIESALSFSAGSSVSSERESQSNGSSVGGASSFPLVEAARAGGAVGLCGELGEG
jgi:hypothetical protein